MDLKIVNAAHNGSGNILWRVADNFQPFYEVDFFANAVGGAALVKETPACETLDQSLRGFPENEWITLRIETKGNYSAVFTGADTTPMLQVTDVNPLSQGAIGIGAGFAAGESDGVWDICFDNVRVTAW